MNAKDLQQAIEKYNEIQAKMGMRIVLLVALALTLGLGMVYAWGYLGFAVWVVAVILMVLSLVVGGLVGMLIAAKPIIDSEMEN